MGQGQHDVPPEPGGGHAAADALPPAPASRAPAPRAPESATN
ncbi:MULTISPECIES: hypothetical protein [Streptomyces]|nr:hypothetical protein [Streptomyces sp. ADI95-16]